MTHRYYITIHHNDTSFYRVNDATGEYQQVTRHQYPHDRTRYSLTSGSCFLMPVDGITRIEASRYKTVLAHCWEYHTELE